MNFTIHLLLSFVINQTQSSILCEVILEYFNEVRDLILSLFYSFCLQRNFPLNCCCFLMKRWHILLLGAFNFRLILNIKLIITMNNGVSVLWAATLFIVKWLLVTWEDLVTMLIEKYRSSEVIVSLEFDNVLFFLIVLWDQINMTKFLLSLLETGYWRIQTVENVSIKIRAVRHWPHLWVCPFKWVVNLTVASLFDWVGDHLFLSSLYVEQKGKNYYNDFNKRFIFI